MHQNERRSRAYSDVLSKRGWLCAITGQAARQIQVTVGTAESSPWWRGMTSLQEWMVASGDCS
jgi:hypothetical protein